MKIVIVDYGLGNIRSITSTLKYLGIEDVVLSADFDMLKLADKLILPGVGSFGNAMKLIRAKKIDHQLNELVFKEKKPILGICLGMQLLSQSSNEDGDNAGLGFIDSDVLKFDTKSEKIPHVGFNQIEINEKSKLYKGMNLNPDFYFTHSFRMMGGTDINPSYCFYGEKFIASFEKNNIAGVQFHPELSQGNGLKLLKNFIEIF